MDWPLAITRNKDALQRIVAALFAMMSVVSGRGPLSVGCADTSPQRGEVKGPALGLTSPRERGEVVREADRRGEFTLPRRLYHAILAILRPAESALRRLIVIAAHGVVLKPRDPRPLPAGLPAFASNPEAKTPTFGLFDTLKSFTLEDYDNNALPHAHFFHGADALHQAPDILPPANPINAAPLFTRLRALRHALTDIPRQARRLARWQARRDLLLKARRRTRMSPMRPGLAPGWRQRPVHNVDDVLKECHRLALSRLNST